MSIQDKQDKAAALANRLNSIDVRYKVTSESITGKANEQEIAFYYEKICRGGEPRV